MITQAVGASSPTLTSTPQPYSTQTAPSQSAAPIELDYISLPAPSHPSPAPTHNPCTSYVSYPSPPSTQYAPSGHVPSHSYDQQQQYSYQPVLSSMTVADDAAAAAVDSSYTDKFQPKEVEMRYIQHIFNPKKKTFWVFWIIILAIIFGILGGTVWNPKPKEENKSPPPDSNNDWATCRRGCSAVSNTCESSCRSNDSLFQSCVSKCTPDMKFCDFDCRTANPCFIACNKDWGNCASACP